MLVLVVYMTIYQKKYLWIDSFDMYETRQRCKKYLTKS